MINRILKLYTNGLRRHSRWIVITVSRILRQNTKARQIFDIFGNILNQLNEDNDNKHKYRLFYFSWNSIWKSIIWRFYFKYSINPTLSMFLVSMSMRSESYGSCKTDMYTLQSFHLLWIIVDLLLIVFEKRTRPCNFYLNQWSLG